jgi:hypothetical protein
MLSRLDSRWLVMHAVPVGRRGSDIDHVVVGPAGVFTVNTKNHSGQRVWVAGRNVMVAGVRCDHIRNSEYEANRVVKLFSAALEWPVPVRPVIAVFDPKRLDIKSRPTGVDVVDARRLVRWLRKRPAVLGSDEVAQIHSGLGIPATWDRQPDQHEDLDRREQFEALQTSIVRSRWLRRAWALGLVAALAAAAFLFGQDGLRLITSQLEHLIGASA